MKRILFLLIIVLGACDSIFKSTQIPQKTLFADKNEVSVGQIISFSPQEPKDFQKNVYDADFGGTTIKVQKVSDSTWLAVVPQLPQGKHNLKIKVKDDLEYQSEFTLTVPKTIDNTAQYITDFVGNNDSYLAQLQELSDTMANRFLIEKQTEDFMLKNNKDTLAQALVRQQAANTASKQQIAAIIAANRTNLDKIRPVLKELLGETLRLYKNELGFSACDLGKNWQRNQCLYSKYVNVMALLANQNLLYAASLGLNADIAPLYVLTPVLKTELLALRFIGIALNYYGFIYEPSQSKLILDGKALDKIENQKTYKLQVRAAYRCIAETDTKLNIDWINIIIKNTQTFNRLLAKSKLAIFQIRMLDNGILVNNYQNASLESYTLKTDANAAVKAEVQAISFFDNVVTFRADCQDELNFDYILVYDDKFIKNESRTRTTLVSDNNLEISELSFRVMCNTCSFRNNANYGLIKVTVKFKGCTDNKGVFEMTNILGSEKVITETPFSKAQLNGNQATFDIEYYNGTNDTKGSLVSAEMRYRSGTGKKSIQLLLDIPR